MKQKNEQSSEAAQDKKQNQKPSGQGLSHQNNEYGGPRLQDPQEQGKGAPAVRNKSGAV